MPRRSPTRLALVVVCVALAALQAAYQAYGAHKRDDYDIHLEVIEALRRGEVVFPHFAFHLVVALASLVVPVRCAVIAVMALANGATGLLTLRALNDREEGKPRAALLVIGLLLCAPINLLTFPKLYFGYLQTVTYHNPTVNALKPLALALFLLIEGRLLALARPIDRRALITLAALTLVSTMTKPSYALALVPALVIYGLLRLQSIDRQSYSRALFAIAACSGTAIAWQFVFLFHTHNKGEGVAFAPFQLIHLYEPSVLRFALKALASIAFPLTIAILRRRDRSDEPLALAWITFATAMAWFVLLTETGTRSFHGNFIWGVQIALFILFVVSARAWMRFDGWRARIGGFVLTLHIACGAIVYCASLGLLGRVCRDDWWSWCW
jgi:hypothetical protein